MHSRVVGWSTHPPCVQENETDILFFYFVVSFYLVRGFKIHFVFVVVLLFHRGRLVI